MDYLPYRRPDADSSGTDVLHAGTPESPRTLCGEPADEFTVLDGVAEDYAGDTRWCGLCREALTELANPV